MDMYQVASTQQPAAICALKSPVDAIHILEAVRLGLVPRVTRRLTGHERSLIRPGTVWVWEEEETNMRRWTDGRRWGASRVGGGGFLVYTESSESITPPPGPDGPYGSNGYYNTPRRPESLIKQTYSTTMTHPVTGKVKKFHVVAYSSKHNPQGDVYNPLPLPHQLPALTQLSVQSGIWPEWETRRATEYNNARRLSLAAATQAAASNPTANVSSPAMRAYPPHGAPAPPTAYQPAYPPREDYHRPPQYEKAPFASPGLISNMDGGLSQPIGKFTQAYQSPPRKPTDFAPSGLAGQPPRHAHQAPHKGSDCAGANPGASANTSAPKRYHPYSQPNRASEHRPSSYLNAGPSSASATPDGGPPRDMDAYAHQSWMNGARLSPSQQYPYGYPPSRPAESTRDRPYYDVQAPPAPYGDYSDSRYLGEGAYEYKRYAGGEPEQSSYSFRGMPPYGIPPPSDRPAQYTRPGSRSPKLPLSSSMLSNPPGSTGVTLPPLRSTFGDPGLPDGGPGHLPPSHKLSPSSKNALSDGERSSRSPLDVKPKLNSWGEDDRQLGELARRVNI